MALPSPSKDFKKGQDRQDRLRRQDSQDQSFYPAHPAGEADPAHPVPLILQCTLADFSKKEYVESMSGFTQTYQHRVSELGVEALWEQTNVPPFNELIVSWNALRPLKGNYHLSVSVRCRGEWSEWLPYAQWGADGQKTFDSRHLKSRVCTYQDIVHLAEDQVGDAFRIKVESTRQANLERFDTLYACASDLKQFDILHPEELEAVRLPIESLYSQMTLKHPRHRDLCSPSSTCMAIDFLLKKRAANPVDFAAKVHDGTFDIFGNWVLNVAESYHRLFGRYDCRVERLPDFTTLHNYLKEGVPVVVSVKGPLPKAPFPFNLGHLFLVYGYDPIEQRIFCADPAHPSDSQTPTYYPLKDFLAAWARRKNLSYVFSLKK